MNMLIVLCQSQEDMVLLNNVTRILELAVPLVEHPSETFLAQLEEDMMKLILKHGMMVVVHTCSRTVHYHVLLITLCTCMHTDAFAVAFRDTSASTNCCISCLQTHPEM